MSGATAAHASYNGSGTQGLAVTNKINDVGDITSVIWHKDKTTKQLLHGSAIIEVPSSGDGSNLGSNLIFTLNSDMDVIGDLYLFVKIFPSAAYTIRKEQALLSVINRIEFQCGTQIWQTLEFADILALNTTELTEGAYEKFMLGLQGFETDAGYATPAVNAASAATTRFFTVKLPLLTRTVCPVLNNYSNVVEGGFLTAAAPNQTVKIKVFTNTVTDISANYMMNLSGTVPMEMKLFGKHIIMCNEEREQIRNIPGGLTKRVKLTQNKEETSFTLVGDIYDLQMDCDHFSLYASHLIIQVFDTTQFGPDDMNVLSNATPAQLAPPITLLEADLKLNSTSFCGKLPGGLMSGALPESMGLYVNQFMSRNVPHNRTLTYVFPLSNTAYSGSCVPLNRFDNIRLSLKLKRTLSSIAGITGNPTLYKIAVTCVGESTALYKQGAASISMY
jgi:hypothetical protein